MICANPTELSILMIGRFISDNYNLGEVSIDMTYDDGQLRKFVSTKQFSKLFPDFEFTSIEDGITETITWFNETKDHSI
jgi:hypothetical protein